jgi:hypothetical protein
MATVAELLEGGRTGDPHAGQEGAPLESSDLQVVHCTVILTMYYGVDFGGGSGRDKKESGLRGRRRLRACPTGLDKIPGTC